jgi:signal transduction histidine kinase
LHIIGRNPLVGDDGGLGATLGRAKQALAQAGDLVRQTMDRTREPSLIVRRVPELQDVASRLAEIGPLIRWICEPDVALSIDLVEGLPQVRCSGIDLQNAVLNLVINARDAMPHGGRLGLSARLSEPRESLPRAVEIEVADNGVGMSPETLRLATRPLFTTKPQGRGTGLGLATTQRFAQEAGGRLDIASAPGAGATVTIRLPC